MRADEGKASKKCQGERYRVGATLAVVLVKKGRILLMDIAAIKRLIDEGKIEYVKIGTPDIEGIYRGKRVAASHFLNSLEDGFAQCDVLFGWDIAENVLPNLKVSALRPQQCPGTCSFHGL